MKQTKQQIKLSRFMSFALRHKPEDVDLTLDHNGWASIHELVAAHNLQNPSTPFAVQDVLDVVRTCDKQRYSVSMDQTKIRANQGHSIEGVDVELKETVPPSLLFHGTATRFFDVIKAEGIKKMARNRVHLSSDSRTAYEVGDRHGNALVLTIDTERMHSDGVKFWLSENGVWLTEYVDPKYILTKGIYAGNK